MPSLPPLRVVKGYWTAVVKIEGKRSTRSFDRSDQVTEEAAKKCLSESILRLSATSPLTVGAVIDDYLDHAKTFYVRDDGTPTGEYDNLCYGLAPLSELFGGEPAKELKPRHLKVFMQSQAKAKVSRQTINKRLGMAKRMLHWAADEERIPSEVWRDCQAVITLKAGRGAREAKAIRAVPIAQVQQTVAHLPAVIQTMVNLQLLTAMRPEEVCALRMADLDVSQSPWLYVPIWHKNKHRGHERRIYMGPQAQALIQPYMANRALEEALFSPREAVKDRRGKYPRRRISDSYSSRTYRRAIWYACDQAFPLPDEIRRLSVRATGRKLFKLESRSAWRKRLGEQWSEVVAWHKEHRWSPNRLRKLALDVVRRQHGEQAAKAYAGHSRVETTQDYYLTQDDTLAREVALKAG